MGLFKRRRPKDKTSPPPQVATESKDDIAERRRVILAKLGASYTDNRAKVEALDVLDIEGYDTAAVKGLSDLRPAIATMSATLSEHTTALVEPTPKQIDAYISSYRPRLRRRFELPTSAAADAPQPPKLFPHPSVMFSRFDSWCSLCGASIHEDIDRIANTDHYGWSHYRCAAKLASASDRPSEPIDEPLPEPPPPDPDVALRCEGRTKAGVHANQLESSGRATVRKQKQANLSTITAGGTQTNGPARVSTLPQHLRQNHQHVSLDTSVLSASASPMATPKRFTGSLPL